MCSGWRVPSHTCSSAPGIQATSWWWARRTADFGPRWPADGRDRGRLPGGQICRERGTVAAHMPGPAGVFRPGTAGPCIPRALALAPRSSKRLAARAVHRRSAAAGRPGRGPRMPSTTEPSASASPAASAGSDPGAAIRRQAPAHRPLATRDHPAEAVPDHDGGHASGTADGLPQPGSIAGQLQRPPVAATAARRAVTGPPWPWPSSTALTGCSASWPRI